MTTARKAEVVALFSAINGVWPLLCAELNAIKARNVDSLITAEDPEIRGRIKQINDLLDLPTSLLIEMRALEDALPEQGASD